jgi:hypothetical protein
MPAFSVATNGDLACFARGVNVGVAAKCELSLALILPTPKTSVSSSQIQKGSIG